MFEKSGFNYHGGYLTYDDKFVARFKYGGGMGVSPFNSISSGGLSFMPFSLLYLAELNDIFCR